MKLSISAIMAMMMMMMMMTFGQDVPKKYTPLPLPALDLRENLIVEECQEFSDAADAYRLKVAQAAAQGIDCVTIEEEASMVDALADILVVTIGACLAMGIDPDTIVAEAMVANFTKLGEDGKPIYRGSDKKVLKGPNYKAPDFTRFVLNNDGMITSPDLTKEFLRDATTLYKEHSHLLVQGALNFPTR